MLMFFNLEIAVCYGTYPALIGQNFWYWVKENRKAGKNFHDGRYWVYNSVSSLHKTFPNLTEYQIRHAIDVLVKGSILLKGNYNRTRYDRTTWYTFTDEGTVIFQNAEMEGRKNEFRAV